MNPSLSHQQSSRKRPHSSAAAASLAASVEASGRDASAPNEEVSAQHHPLSESVAMHRLQHQQASSASSSKSGESSSDRSGALPLVSNSATNATTTSSSGGDDPEAPRHQRKVDGGFGLPPPHDDRLSAHASVVVAHLHPPSSDGESEKDPAQTTKNSGSQNVLGYDTIRRTFRQVSRRSTSKRSRRSLTSTSRNKVASQEDLKKKPNAADSSSGSGTEGGYAGSASSDGHGEARVGSCSSPSVSSGEDQDPSQPSSRAGAIRPLLRKRKEQESKESSSDLADFSSGSMMNGDADSSSDTLNDFGASDSNSITSSSNGEGSDEDNEFAASRRPTHDVARKRRNPGLSAASLLDLQVRTSSSAARQKSMHNATGPTLDGKPPLLNLSCDLMAHVVTFLEPPEIVNVLTMPLSKDWLEGYARQPGLWRVLCHLEPFKAKVEDEASDEEDSDTGEDSIYSFPMRHQPSVRTVGKFRVLYSSFVRCMRYLERIKQDARQGNPPPPAAASAQNVPFSVRNNQGLQDFLARARGGPNPLLGAASSSSSLSEHAGASTARAVGLSDDGSSVTPPPRKRRRRKDKSSNKKRVRYGRSMITDRLLGPAADGTPSELNLPWSCAIYSIVNWMVAFPDVEGIQTMCLKVLPFLLENDQQRVTAQRANLARVILRGMVLFPNSVQLHTASFHAIVLLARPLGGQEGMLYNAPMINASDIFANEDGSDGGRNGIAIMLDSMQRFRNNAALQAMSCWSLVNIALAPAQKKILVKLGGIRVATEAIVAHPYNAEVQFRAMFALINLVIPPPPPEEDADDEEDMQAGAPPAEEDDASDRALLDEMVNHIVRLVVLAMKNFCSSVAILNRACLVLHNLSLTRQYHDALLLTPTCYQMLEWCLTNYRTDQVLQQSAAGTLHRLQMTLSSDESLRSRFSAALQAQQQQSLEEAHREAQNLRTQQEQQQ